MLTRLPAQVAVAPDARGGARTATDACPGVLRPHHAADGELVRIRVPGGLLAASALLALRSLAVADGDGRIGLTSRANLQLRGLGLDALPRVADGLRAAGLLQDAEHERVRNILGPGLPGRLPGQLSAGPDDVDRLVAQLDAGLCSRPRLAGLPGRFLFGVDDGRGELVPSAPDVRLVALGDGRFGVDVAGAGGPVVARSEAVGVALAVAEAFLDELAEPGTDVKAWRIAELTDGPARVLARLGLDAQPFAHDHDKGFRRDHARIARGGVAPGLVEQVDGRFAVCATAPLGLVDADQAEALAAAARLTRDHDPSVRLTPWRRVVVPDLDLPAALAARELLDATGLVVVRGTGWDRLTACAGRPGCAKSLTDVHADARAMVAGLAPIGPVLHLAGCERSCGAPSGAARAVATRDGYVIGPDDPTAQEEKAELVAALGRIPSTFSSPADPAAGR